MERPIAQELLVADHLGGPLERWQIVAAVVNQRRRVLEHDLVVVREAVGAEQVALPDLDAIDAELLRRDVEQLLAHEHAMLLAMPRTGVTIGLLVKTAVNSLW